MASSSSSKWSETSDCEGDTSDIPGASGALNDNSNDDDDEVTALQDFLAGGLAGSASVIVGHPFDTMKVGGLCLLFLLVWVTLCQSSRHYWVSLFICC